MHTHQNLTSPIFVCFAAPPTLLPRLTLHYSAPCSCNTVASSRKMRSASSHSSLICSAFKMKDRSSDGFQVRGCSSSRRTIFGVRVKSRGAGISRKSAKACEEEASARSMVQRMRKPHLSLLRILALSPLFHATVPFHPLPWPRLDQRPTAQTWATPCRP